MWEGAIMAAACAATELRDSSRDIADALVRLQRAFEGARRGCWVVRVIRSRILRCPALPRRGPNLISFRARLGGAKVTLEHHASDVTNASCCASSRKAQIQPYIP